MVSKRLDARCEPKDEYYGNERSGAGENPAEWLPLATH